MMKGGLCLVALALCSFVGLVVCTMLNGTASPAGRDAFMPTEWVHPDTAAAQRSAGDIPEDAVAPALRQLSRRKRYVAFPEGSSFSVAFCLTIGFVGNPEYSYISWSTNWGVAYDLPNETWILDRGGRPATMPRPVVVRRHRRDLYERLETVIDNMGYAGRQCIFRALCESSQYFGRRKSNLAVEMVKTIFSLPRSKVLPFEHTDLHAYDEAHRRGHNQANCPQLFPSCTLSLIDFALGQYMHSNSWFR